MGRNRVFITLFDFFGVLGDGKFLNASTLASGIEMSFFHTTPRKSIDFCATLTWDRSLIVVSCISCTACASIYVTGFSGFPYERWMVWFSNGGLKCLIFKWSALLSDQTIWNPDKKVSEKSNVRSWIFRWWLYNSISLKIHQIVWNILFVGTKRLDIEGRVYLYDTIYFGISHKSFAILLIKFSQFWDDFMRVCRAVLSQL